MSALETWPNSKLQSKNPITQTKFKSRNSAYINLPLLKRRTIWVDPENENTSSELKPIKEKDQKVANPEVKKHEIKHADEKKQRNYSSKASGSVPLPSESAKIKPIKSLNIKKKKRKKSMHRNRTNTHSFI